MKTPLSAQILSTYRQCFPGPKHWTASWISSREQLRQVISRCRSNRIDTASQQAPAVDFDRYGVLAVEMGEKPTAGYSIDTGKITAYVEGETAVVNLTCHEPAPGAIAAQVITSPWILVRLPVGGYHVVRVVDQNGRLLAQLKLP